MVRWTIGLAALLGCLGATERARACSFYVENGVVPNVAVNGCATCHDSSAGGGSLNPFGYAFNGNQPNRSDTSCDASRAWSAGLGALDSDGDGYTNAQELLDPSSGYSGSTWEVRNPGVSSAMDECDLGWHDCSEHARCVERYEPPPGGFDCACLEGWTGDGRTCADVNECLDGGTACSPGSCVNLQGDWTCSCPSGYQVDPESGHACAREGSCGANPGVCGAHGTCVDTSAGYRCDCRHGYAFEEGTCVYRGCAADPCGPDAVGCEDTGATSYECLCAAGERPDWTSSGTTCVEAAPRRLLGYLPWEVADCDETLDWGYEVCRAAGDCAILDEDNAAEILERGGATCSCYEEFDHEFGGGYIEYLECWDEDECAGDPCGPGSCTDAALDFSCQCPSGYHGTGTHACHAIADCDSGTADCCESGYRWDAATDQCVDDDECARHGGLCGPGACVNQDGGWSCTCPDGWGLGEYETRTWGVISSCFDVRECDAHDTPCDDRAERGQCVEQPGSYECRCVDGYQDVNGSCEDVDECADGTPCGVGSCTNTLGSYECTCPEGFEASSGACLDVDECDSGAAGCAEGEPCTNLPGAFVCGCVAGFEVDGDRCADVDECAAGTDFCDDARESCTNTIGGYQCDCADGFVRTEAGACVDVDECLDGTDDCGESARCVNVLGSFLCECPDGWMPVDRGCVLARPCEDATLVCPEREVCLDPPDGDAACVCAPGYARDDGVCRPVCSDGVRTPGEACDDGNTAAGDGCDACSVESGYRCTEVDGTSHCERSCGDGLIDEGEQCDGGSANDDDTPNACRTDCRRAFCGDGVVDDGELCDPAGGSPLPVEACSRCADGSVPGADGGVGPSAEADGGCSVSPGRGGPHAALLLLGVIASALVRRRRRRRAAGAVEDDSVVRRRRRPLL